MLIKEADEAINACPEQSGNHLISFSLMAVAHLPVSTLRL